MSEQPPSYPGYPGYPGPGGYPQGPAGPMPDNNLVWGILTTLFCCLPLGIASIVFAAQVNSKWGAGDVAGAHESAQRARQFAVASAAVGAAATIIGILVVVGAGLSIGFYGSR